MPGRWLASVEGRAEPRLDAARLRSAHCHLWQTEGLSSGLGMLGARLALEVTPEVLDPDQRPAVLRACPGAVARLDEPVLDVGSVLAVLAERNRAHLVKVADVEFETDVPGAVVGVTLVSESGAELRIPAATVVLTAGQGNDELRRRAGLAAGRTQRRPLHMVMVRGPLPELHGHCVDGGATRATITTVRDSRGRVVWVIGGLVAEQGVTMTRALLLGHTRQELEAILPGLDLAGCEWATWRVDRAERAMPGGRRPDDVQILVERNVITAWPTKLALAPRLADRLLDQVPFAEGPMPDLPPDWPRPAVARPPWETEAEWTRDP